MSFTTKSLTRAITAAFRDAAPVQGVYGLVMVIFVMYTGYIIPMPSMIRALKWITWINVRRRF
jgi:ATP-binding cassette subfamily G (WHITE) protein 2 (SNQ2)